MNGPRELYEQMVLDHNRNPRNYPYRPVGEVRQAHGFNPLCGDEFTIYLKVEDGIVEEAGFDGAGCAISTASASMMTEAVQGMRVEDARELFRKMHVLLTRGEADDGIPAKLTLLGGVREHPTRIKCATLAWHTLNAALEGLDGTVCTE